MEFIDDLLDTRTSLTNACTDRIDIGIVAQNSHLCAFASFTCDRFDLDRSLEDLRHFFFKQSSDEHRISS